LRFLRYTRSRNRTYNPVIKSVALSPCFMFSSDPLCRFQTSLQGFSHPAVLGRNSTEKRRKIVKSREETRSLATFPRPMSATGRMAFSEKLGEKRPTLPWLRPKRRTSCREQAAGETSSRKFQNSGILAPSTGTRLKLAQIG
jgi:hypothetical protein